MRKLIVFLALLALFLTSVVPGFAQDRPSLAELLQNDADGRFTTLLTAFDAAGLSGSLDSTPLYSMTLLAPTNDAFAALSEQTGISQDDLLANKATLRQILLYHMIPGKYLFRNLTSGPTLASGLLGESVTFGFVDGFLNANTSPISDPDNLASNGVMHVVDAVLLPPEVIAMLATPEPTPEAPVAEVTPEPTAEPTPEATPVAGVAAERPDILTWLENDADGRFTTLLAALDVSVAKRLLESGEVVTLLAPTNDAFTALLEQSGMTAEALLADKATLTKVLLYHILPGQYLFRNLTSGPTLPSQLLGQSVTFGFVDGFLNANTSPISDLDNLAANGVVQVVDAVLLPPDVAAALIPAEPEATPEPTEAPVVEATPEPTAEPTPVAGVPAERPDLLTLLQNDADGRFTMLVAAINAAGLSDELSTGGPFTLLAPTNDALTAAVATLGVSPEQLMGDSSLLADVLLYHVLPGRYLYRTMTAGSSVDTLLEGQQVTFQYVDGFLNANTSPISDPDNLASNGVMHVVDAVLLPPEVIAMLATPEPTPEAPVAEVTPEPTAEPTPEATPVAGVAAERPDILTWLENDADGRFTTLLAALDVSVAKRLLESGEVVTLLAPTNDAFTALLEQSGMTAEALLADKATLTKVLLYHILPGQYLFRNLTSGPTLPSQLLGQSVTFGFVDGFLNANTSPISDLDNLAANGVVQVVDAVLLPPDVAAALIPAETTVEPTALPEGSANLRFVHLATETVDLSVDGQPAVTNVVPGAISAWMSVAAGTYQVSVSAAGAELASFSVDIGENEYVTVALTGSATSLRANTLVENFSPNGESVARLSIFNGVEGSNPYDIGLGNRLVVTALGYPGSLGSNDGFYTVDVPAGTYTVQFFGGSAPASVVASLPETAFEAGKNYFIAVSGTPDAPSVISTTSDIPSS